MLISVVSAAEEPISITGFKRDTVGFFGPDSWYLNHEANERYAATAANGGVLELPVLFLAARYDYTCECTVNTRLAEPMRRHCRDLTEHTLDTGHWMAQEQPAEVNAALVAWLRDRVADHWPTIAGSAGR